MTNQTSSFMNARTFRSEGSYSIGSKVNTTLQVPSRIRSAVGDYNTAEGTFLLFDDSTVTYYPSGVSTYVEVTTATAPNKIVDALFF